MAVERILIIRLLPLCCFCAIVVITSRSLSARFRPAWLIVADVGTFVLRELADDPEKPCQVKFTWRYATNSMNLQNTKSSDVFTDDFDFVFT